MALFASQVKDWVEKTEVQQTTVLHQALRLLDAELAEATPVVTGNLRNSRAVTSLARPRIEWKTKKFRDPSDQISNGIAGVEIGQTAWLGYRAPYAYAIEKKYAFARLAAQRWPVVIDQAARMVVT